MTNHTQIPLPLPDTTVEIPLTQGKFAIVDAVDADLLEYKWRAQRSFNTYYAARSTHTTPQHTERLHRTILSRILNRELLSSENVDHEDGNGLNCVRSNLRLATTAQNNRNQRRRSDSKSGFKGVFWQADKRKWRARICVNGKNRSLGYFATPEEAHEAYCKAAKELFGEFARFE